MKEIIEIEIDGLMIEEELETREKEQIINLSLNQKYQLITKTMWTDYKNCLYQTDELLSQTIAIEDDKQIE